MGTIFFVENDGALSQRKIPSNNIPYNSLHHAKPLHPNLRYIPLKNELVALYIGADTTESPLFYYTSVMNVWNHPHHNALPSRGEMNKIRSQGENNDYDVSGEGGVKRRSEDGETGVELGNYVSESLDIKPLNPYEGDFILEGRFGNSIRFGSTNNSKNITTKNPWSSGDVKTGDPITIIRNGQEGIRVPINDQEAVSGWVPGNESINGDDSSIYLTSNQVLVDFQASGLTESEEPWIVSWPSFGSEDITEVANQIPFEADQTGEDLTEEMTDEELNQASAGEDEIADTGVDPENPEEDEMIYFSQLPDTEEEAENEAIRQFCDYLFGPYCFLPLLAGQKHIVGIYEELIMGSKSYYPQEDNQPTHTITKEKLYEVLVYYDVKVSMKPSALMKLAKSPMQIGFLGSKDYFRPHYTPQNNTIHIPSIEAIKHIFEPDGPGTNRISTDIIDEHSRIMCLDNVWAEVAHSADIDINGFFGYVKDEWKDLVGGIAELFGKRQKNKDKPEGALIVKNSGYTNEELLKLKIFVDDIGGDTGLKFKITIKDIPGKSSGFKETLELEFSSDTQTSTKIKRFEDVVEDLLRSDYDINVNLQYVDLSLISQRSYDDAQHYEGRTHQIVEVQLANEWLQEHNGEEECDKNRVIHVSAMEIETVEKAYEKEIATQGENTPPIKHQNIETGEYVFRSADWPEIEPFIQDQTNLNKGSNPT